MPNWVIVVLAAFGGGLLCLALIFAVLRHYLRKLVSAITAGAVPVRIKVVPKPESKPWKVPKAVAEARKFFETRNFRWVGDMALEPMEGVYASMLVNEDGFAAVLYDHHLAGFFVDVVVRYQERGGLTVSSAPQGGNLESPPFSQKFYLPGGSLQEVWTLFQDKVRALPQEGRLSLNTENVAKQFEQAYADEVDWRNAQGGPKEEEIRRIAADSHPKAEDEQIQEAATLQQAMAKAGLLEGLQERFRETITPEQSLHFRMEDLCFIHARSSQEDLLEYISECIEDEEYEPTSLPDDCRDLPPLEAFEKLQTCLPELLRFKRVGSLDFPLLTHVYRRPNGAIPIELLPHRRMVEGEEEC